MARSALSARRPNGTSLHGASAWARQSRSSSAPGAQPLEELGREVLRSLAGLRGRRTQRAQMLAPGVAQCVGERRGKDEGGDDGYGDDRCERHMRENTVATDSNTLPT